MICQYNPKGVWNYANMKTNSKDKIGDLINLVVKDGSTQVTGTDATKAEALCNLFSSVFVTESDWPFTPLRQCTMYDTAPLLITECDIMSKLDKINQNKYPGPDLYNL